MGPRRWSRNGRPPDRRAPVAENRRGREAVSCGPCGVLYLSIIPSQCAECAPCAGLEPGRIAPVESPGASGALGAPAGGLHSRSGQELSQTTGRHPRVPEPARQTSARGRHAEVLTLSALPVVADRPELPEVPTAARGPVRRLPEKGTDRRDC